MLDDASHALVVHVIHAVDLHAHDDGLGWVLLEELLDPSEDLLEREEVVVMVLGEIRPRVFVLSMQQVEVLAVVVLVNGIPVF